ncbi:6-pyruvoyl trahydropterin synthase family protein [Streptomyces lasiicapitis]|uniref:6-pyruvoyl trahydropterin synthase family protein n=1 Tax=Streptomyces lasiicapitis TaxID=1923961 RepID=UPI0036B70FA8
MASITVRHNFETAHRVLPLGGKCRNLHGHSWWCEITVAGNVNDKGVLVDFGGLKSGLRAWIDTHLDHGAMLGRDDPLVSALRADGSKVFEFGTESPAGDLDWPTVENVAELLRRVTGSLLSEAGHTDVVCARARVSETFVNAAEVIA